jgi:cell division protein FtsL
MLVRLLSYLFVVIISISIYGLFTIKDSVANLDYQLNVVLKQLDKEHNKIHVLKAEQSYLTSPARLRRLASSYLKLDTIKISQMVKSPLISDQGNATKPNNTSRSFVAASNNKWRYKTIANTKYIKTVSSRKLD